MEVYEALRYTEIGHRPVFDLSTVTVKNAEDKIGDFADQLVLSESGGGLSVLKKAKKRAVEDAARKVNSLAVAAVPDVIDQLTPEFSRHVAAYVEAVNKLPGDLTAESLVAAGPEAVAMYGVAQQDAAYLNNVSNWVASTNELPGGSARHENVIRILRPKNGLELIKLDEASRTTGNPALAALNPVLVAAARLGIEFGINTPREAVDIRRGLELVITQERQQRPQGVAFMPSTV